MLFVILTVLAYLGFNLAIFLSIGQGGALAIAVANVIGALVTAAFFRRQLNGVKPWVAALGSIGILLIVVGLRQSHTYLPVSLSMEAVYNLFAISSWPLFVLLNLKWSKHFSERPNRFDLGCHFVMAGLVLTRFATYGEYVLSIASILWILVAVAGYSLFNVSIKLSAGSRATNVLMNVGGGLLITVYSLSFDGIGALSNWTPEYSWGLLLGGLSIFGIVWALGASYTFFGQKGQGSLVAPMVYDGLLIAAPSVMLVTGETGQLSVWTFVVAYLMLVVTFVRYRHHNK